MDVTSKVENKLIPSNVNEKNGDGGKRLSEGCTALMYACQQGLTDQVVEELRKKPNTVLHRDKSNKSALHYCTGQKNLIAAASISIAAPNLMESADEDGFTPLHLAVIQGNLSVVNLLLANNADVNALDNEGHSVVHWATVCGEIESLRAVLAAGANISTPDINGGSPLHYAAQMCGANYEGKSNKAASKLALVILNILLAHPGSSVEVEDKDGRQPLLWAASAGSTKAVLALLKAGARVESSDKDGLTALHCAASRGHTECIDTLINLHGAQTDLIDSNGCTALHYAVTLGHADATVLLLKLGADPNRQDRKGRTPAHCGCAKGQMETVKILSNYEGNLWLRNAKGDLPVHEAANSGRRDLVEWLLEQKPNFVNTASNDGKTLLHVAASTDNADMCKMLLDLGADVNCLYRTNKNIVMTPLDWALQKGYRATAKYIQMHGGLPAKKLRLSGKNCNILPDSVLPLKSPDVEHTHETKHTNQTNSEAKGKEPKKFKTKSSSKRYVIYVRQSDSESYDEQFYGRSRRRYRQPQHNRRTNSCSDTFKLDNEDSSEMNRSKSNMELHRHVKCCCHVMSSAGSSAEDDRHQTKEKNSHHSCSGTSKKQKCRSRKDSECCECKKFAKRKRKKEQCNKNEQVDSIGETSGHDSEGDQIAEKHIHEMKVKERNSTEKLEEEPSNEHKDDNGKQASEDCSSSHSRSSSGRKRPQSAKFAAVQKRKDQRKLEESEQQKGIEFLRSLSNEISDPESKAKHIVIQAEVHLKYTEPERRDALEEDIQTDATYTIDQPEKFDEPELSEGPPSAAQPDSFMVVKETVPEEKEGQETIIEEKTESMVIQESPKKVTFQADQASENPPLETQVGSESENFESQQEIKSDINVNIIPAEESENEEDMSNNNSNVHQDVLDAENGRKSPQNQHTLNEQPEQEVNDNDVSGDDNMSVTSFVILDQNENEIEQPNEVHEVQKKGKERSSSLQSESFQLLDTTAENTTEQKPNEIDKNGKRRRVKKRNKTKTTESETEDDLRKSKDQDSGFEPSPISLKSTKIPTANYRQTFTALPDKNSAAFTRLDDLRTQSGRTTDRKPGDKNAVNMTTVTQSIQKNIRRYCMERKIFQHLLELKSLQIRSNKTNEAILVKRAVEDYHKSTVALGYETGRTLKRYPYTEYTFKNFELFLYETLKGLQKNGTFNFQNISDVYREAERRLSPDANAYERALQCTTKTHRCLHAAHAYTGVPCAAYIPMMNHHTMPKFGFGTYKNGGVGSFYLPKILLDGKKCTGRVALELSHGNNKQLIPLPSDKMDSNKKYYVTFTVKDNENQKQQLIEKTKNA